MPTQVGAMRTLAAIAAIVAVFAVVVFGAGSAFGVWDGGAGRASTPLGKAAKKTLKPHERLTMRDTAIARAAVIRSSNLAPRWRKIAPPARSSHGCPGSKPDLSRFTITGKAQAMFKSPRVASIDSKVKIFSNAGQADEYFRLTSGQAVLDCMRDGVEGMLRDLGLSPKRLSAKLLTAPAFGEQTMIYTFSFSIAGADGHRYEYPVDVVTFRMGRAIAACSFSFIASKSDEVGLARVVAGRLSLSARG